MSNLHLGLWPVFRDKVNGVIFHMEDDGLNTDIFSGFRSAEEQEKLYALGRTLRNLDGIDDGHPMGRIVTNAKGGQSWHNYGLAADIVFKMKGAWSWSDKLPWGILGQHVQRLGLEWGGSEEFQKKAGFADRPHVQFTCGLTINDAQDIGDIAKVWAEVERRMMSY